jgi:tryptophan-rich sensory protein
MEFNLAALLFTIGFCLISIIIAGKSGSNEDKEWFKNLNHPDNALMVKFMTKFGIIVYLLYGFVLYYLFVRNDIVPIIVMIIILLIMGFSPLFLYKTKNLKLFFVTNFIIFILLPMLIFFLIQTNLVLAIVVIIYQLWIVYEMSYFYRLMKLNK